MVEVEIIPNLWQFSRLGWYSNSPFLVVNLQSEQGDHFSLPHSEPYCLWVPIGSGLGLSPENLDFVVTTILNVLSQNKKVIVHSEEGIGRASLITSAVLMHLHGHTPDISTQSLQSVLPEAWLNETQQQCLLDYYDYLAETVPEDSKLEDSKLEDSKLEDSKLEDSKQEDKFNDVAEENG